MDERTRNRQLRNAIEAGDLEGLKTLINSNKTSLEQMTPFGTWLHVAASEGHVAVAKYLVEQGIDPNARGGTFNSNALKLAASAGHIDVVEYLLSIGSELDVSEPERNPLFAAIYGGHRAVAALLLEAGIDAHVKYSGENMHDMDALDFACERGQTEIAELIRAGF